MYLSSYMDMPWSRIDIFSIIVFKQSFSNCLASSDAASVARKRFFVCGSIPRRITSNYKKYGVINMCYNIILWTLR